MTEEGDAITDVENTMKLNSGKRTIEFLNNLAPELQKIGVEQFEEMDFEGAIRFFISQKQMDPRERIPALRGKDVSTINGFIKQLNDALEVSQ